jgi:hypothetical protein
VIAIDI